MLIIYDPICAEYRARAHVERPERVLRTAEHLKANHPDWAWQTPKLVSEKDILRAHSKNFLTRLQQPTDFDPDTPAYPDIETHAKRSAGAAIEVIHQAIAGKKCFSLMRPPGHHATSQRSMGFCYLNSIAIAALSAIAEGTKRVAIWDFDAHHGNGTEDIVEGNEQIHFASAHQSPGYPGTGQISRGNIHNYPVAPCTPASEHMRILKKSWEELLEFKPALILVSAGFDAYAKDPITEMSLEKEDFRTLGTWLRETKIPAGAILEGGYSPDLPLLIEAFLEGWEG
jgi:acetoin utilization deacetylase AcuC-like enzyme